MTGASFSASSDGGEYYFKPWSACHLGQDPQPG